jgi:hypothetical protein
MLLFRIPVFQVDIQFNFGQVLPNNVCCVVLSTFDAEYQIRPDGEIIFPSMYDIKMQKPA